MINLQRIIVILFVSQVEKYGERIAQGMSELDAKETEENKEWVIGNEPFSVITWKWLVY